MSDAQTLYELERAMEQMADTSVSIAPYLVGRSVPVTDSVNRLNRSSRFRLTLLWQDEDRDFLKQDATKVTGLVFRKA